jgi:hypothetical protein
MQEVVDGRKPGTGQFLRTSGADALKETERSLKRWDGLRRFGHCTITARPGASRSPTIP